MALFKLEAKGTSTRWDEDGLPHDYDAPFEVWINPSRIVAVYPESRIITMLGGFEERLTDEGFEEFERLCKEVPF